MLKKYLLFKAVYDIIVSNIFKLIIKRGESLEIRIFMLQGISKNIIAKLRIFREKRTMKISCDHIFINDSFKSGIIGVSVSVYNPA